VFAVLKTLSGQFSLIFADPPYADDPVTLLGNTQLRNCSRRVACCVGDQQARDASAGLLWELEREAAYGDTRVCYSEPRVSLV